MSKQKRVSEAAGCDLTFLDPIWDSALLGFVESGKIAANTVKACYGYQALKAVLVKDKKYTPEQTYAYLRHLAFTSASDDYPMLLMRYTRRTLWSKIRQNNYPLWEHMNKAILGLGHNGLITEGVVYSKPICVSILQSKQSTNNNNELKDYAQALTTVEEGIIPIDLGHHTPWFLTPVQ